MKEYIEILKTKLTVYFIIAAAAVALTGVYLYANQYEQSLVKTITSLNEITEKKKSILSENKKNLELLDSFNSVMRDVPRDVNAKQQILIAVDGIRSRKEATATFSELQSDKDIIKMTVTLSLTGSVNQAGELMAYLSKLRFPFFKVESLNMKIDTGMLKTDINGTLYFPILETQKTGEKA
ncbi:MAG: hypothetical protein L7F77_12555 [Candidatus Magnetominusculus sp. LBB02]|nr:hypothetical protein [Candidatus Magnetominusculus sp. LBB02]MCG6553146.1 hypothetical protein [Candidatus Magnetominusculus sp. LBB02]